MGITLKLVHFLVRGHENCSEQITWRAIIFNGRFPHVFITVLNCQCYSLSLTMRQLACTSVCVYDQLL